MKDFLISNLLLKYPMTSGSGKRVAIKGSPSFGKRKIRQHIHANITEPDKTEQTLNPSF